LFLREPFFHKVAYIGLQHQAASPDSGSEFIGNGEGDLHGFQGTKVVVEIPTDGNTDGNLGSLVSSSVYSTFTEHEEI
jgi:hypothetical protein